jgi:hypothetical protein
LTNRAVGTSIFNERWVRAKSGSMLRMLDGTHDGRSALGTEELGSPFWLRSVLGVPGSTKVTTPDAARPERRSYYESAVIVEG